MQLKSTFSWSLLSTFIRLSTAFISMKYMAVMIGPRGVATISQLSNIISIVMVLALGGINNGIIKYTSQFKDDNSNLQKIWHCATFISTILLIPTACILIFCSNFLAQFFLHSVTYKSIFVIFAFSLILYVINNFLLNILIGLHEVKIYNILNATNSIAGVLVNIILIYYFNIYGALLALVTSQSVTCIVTIIAVSKKRWFKFRYFFGNFNVFYIKKLLAYTSMSFVVICVSPLAQLFIRNVLAKNTSWEVVGCWQGVLKISDLYLMVFFMALNTYFIPKLSYLKEQKDIDKEILNGYKFIMPLVIFSASFIYIFREIIIKIVFVESFMLMKDLFLYQLLGDIFKIAAMILSASVLAKAKTRLFLFTEITFGISYILLSYFLISIFKEQGVVLAFFINYVLYFIFFVFLYKSNYLY